MKRYSLFFTIISAALAFCLAVSAAGPGLAAGAGDESPGYIGYTVYTDPTPPPPDEQPATDPSQSSAGLPRIQFEAGATSAVVSGQLEARKAARYVLRAQAGQLLEVSVSSQRRVTLTVYTPGGRALASKVETETSFRGYLPVTGDYVLKVASARRATPFTLTVSIPQRIRFARGATAALLSGNLKAEQGLEYILRAKKGQLLELSVTAPEATDTDAVPLQLVVYGVDGSVLKSGMGEGSTFRGYLPATQDYLVKVRAGNRAVSFNLSVIIPRRIQFAPGEISAQVRGSLASNQTQYFVLRASRNQILRARVRSDRPVQLIVYGVDGVVLKSSAGQSALPGYGTDDVEVEAALPEVIRFSGKLPKSQDYIVAVQAGAAATTYRLRVTIP